MIEELQAQLTAKYEEVDEVQARIDRYHEQRDDQKKVAFAVRYMMQTPDLRFHTVDEEWHDLTWPQAHAKFKAMSEAQVANTGRKLTLVNLRQIVDQLDLYDLTEWRSRLFDEAAELEGQIQLLRRRG